MEMETKAALEKEEAARRAEAAARLGMEKKAALEKEEAARRAEAAARSEMEKKAALEEEEAARKEEQARKAALALQGELEQEELAQKRLVREKEKAAYRAQQERERQLAGQEKSAPAVAASEAKDDEEKNKSGALNAKRAEEMLLLEQQMAFFQGKIRQSKEQALELEKRKLAIMSEGSEATARARTLCFLHACMLDFFSIWHLCFCRTEIEGSPAKACMCMHASKLNANGISWIAAHIMHALNIYMYKNIIYYILIMQVSDETADTQLDETQQPPAQEEAGKPHVATLCLF